MDFWTQIDQNKTIHAHIASHYQKFRSVIATTIEQGMQMGEFQNGNAEHFASLVIAIIDGIALQWLFDNQHHKPI
jgi:hypothetical protein